MIDPEILKQIKPGATVKVTEIIKENPSASSGQAPSAGPGQVKSRTSSFEGLVIARKHGSETGATFMVRATVAGVGVEKVYPINSPIISKVDILNSPKKVGRAKLYYLRGLSKKQIRQKIGV